MKYIVYDLEATCWRGSPPSGHNEVIEIGAFCVNGFGEITDVFNRFIKPKINPILSSFCTELTTIKQHNIDTADKFPSVIEDFMDWIDLQEEFYLIAWGDNDKLLLANDCKFHGFDVLWLNNCVNLKDSYQFLRKLSKGVGLKKAIDFEEIEFEGTHHRAINDAEALVKLFVKNFDLWKF